MSAPLRILVAEDDKDDAHLLRCAFQQAQLEATVHFVADGQELIDYLQGAAPFDDPVSHPLPTLLLLDLDLPRVSGLGVLGWLRTQPSLRKLTVVVLSGSEQPLDRARARDLGVLDFLSKPRQPQDLVRILRELEGLWHKITSAPVQGTSPEKPAAVPHGYQPDSPVI